jgi:hypothetical protein
VAVGVAMWDESVQAYGKGRPVVTHMVFTATAKTPPGGSASSAVATAVMAQAPVAWARRLGRGPATSAAGKISAGAAACGCWQLGGSSVA